MWEPQNVKWRVAVVRSHDLANGNAKEGMRRPTWSALLAESWVVRMSLCVVRAR